MQVCPNCKRVVKDIGKHLRRGRCKVKRGSRAGTPPTPGSREERLERIARMGGW